ncbi:MgtC/SapB family protein [Methylobacillus arboreus]|uniref:MgtC/SapB family protein n=1 Tax=Methylobacillus arboreus TaxID=755170 RepID=UPI001E37A03A|nr:MgtC/SapB family protein [Methylobacillus arboreus]MCB5189484.1 MgtC/SapB family protein [Methylobacillus arboreus]
MPESVSVEVMLNLLIALGAGLLIGAERGWQERDEKESYQSAGIRTFALTGLLGGLSALLSQHLGIAVWVTVLVALMLVVSIAYVGDLRRTGDQGITSELALLITFLLGSLALSGYAMLASAGAVVVALLLSLKNVLHSLLKRLSETELSGALKLLFISVVMLPVLPNETYDPWQVFNPYTTWWMVVLIAALSFIAYIAVRLTGTRYGLMLTAILGSLVSSTAMTLTLSRLSSKNLYKLLAAGLLATSGLMFPRVLLEVAVVNPSLLPLIAWSLGTMFLVYMAGAAVFWRRAVKEEPANAETPLRNPFELGPALRFALLLTLILFLVEAGRRYWGDAGVYLVSLLAGIADVDAITLSLSRSAHHELGGHVAVQGIVLAVISNSVFKAALVGFIGGRELALRTYPVVALGLGAGILVMLMTA